MQRGQRSGAGRRLIHTLADGLLALGYKSLLVWVLEQNPAVAFYLHLGGTFVRRDAVAMGGVDLPELALGWPDLYRLQTGQ